MMKHAGLPNGLCLSESKLGLKLLFLTSTDCINEIGLEVISVDGSIVSGHEL
jgi:hypothetical protein